MAGKVTIADVAKAAGVSASTVSHALSGKRPISEKVKGRIAEIISKLGYHPDYFAQSMRSGRTRFVGIVVDQCRDLFTSEILDTFWRLLNEKGCDVVLYVAGNSTEHGEVLIRKCASGPVDGVINMLPQISSSRAVELCGTVPVITFLRHQDGPLQIDFIGAMSQLFEYLRSQGHRRIAYLYTEPICFCPEDPRLEIYSNLMLTQGMKPSCFRLENNNQERDVVWAMREAGHDVTAVICGDDWISCDVYRWAYENNMRIPDDISVAGFDDSKIVSSLLPPLTTFQIPIEAMVAHTVNVFMRHLDGEHSGPELTILKPTMVVRRSVNNILTI